MATAGELSTSAWSGNNGDRYLDFNWSRVSYDASAQTTTIEWSLYSNGSYDGYVMAAPFIVSIDGVEEYYSGTRIKLYQNQYIASGTKTIKHNADGTRSFTVSVRAAIYSGSINCSGAATFTLNPVGAAFITAAPNFTDEENPTITYQNTVGNAISNLSAAISLTGENPDIAYRAVNKSGSTYTFTLTDAERNILRAATTGSNTRKVRFYLRSLIEGKYLFSWKEVSFTVVNAMPTIEAAVIDVNTATTALTGDNTTLIRGHSTAQATRAATAYKQATITSEYTEHNGSKNTEANKLFLNVESNVFTFTATDSRKNTVSKTITAQMVDYIKPTANIDTTAQMDTDGSYSLSVSGNYYNDTFGYTNAATSNSIAVSYRYKTQGGNYGGWIALAPTLNGNTYTAAATVSGLDYRETYVFQCSITDKLNSVYSAEITVRSIPVFHWGEDDFTFEVPVNINGDLYVNGEKYEKAQTIDASYGTWQPTLTTAAAVSSYSVRQGWYQKVGNVVSIGWQVKANIKSGYSNYAVALSGCPFTPLYAAFGGGVAHNIQFFGGFNFEGYALGTDGLITLRGQPCNNTTAVNLNITSSVYYPTGNEEAVITLAGSLCFITN